MASIEENSYGMGEVEAQLLFKMMNENTEVNKAHQHIQIPCKLVVHR